MRLIHRVDNIRSRYKAIAPVLDERARRWWAAVEARSLGHGGIECMSEAIGMSRTTIRTGLEELMHGSATSRVRKPGGGRKPLTADDPKLMRDLERLVDPVTRGDPSCPLRWTCKSKENLARALRDAGHEVSASTVGRLLNAMGYSLQSVRKSREGTSHPIEMKHLAITRAGFHGDWNYTIDPCDK